MAEEKISVYSLADLKNTSDDAIPNYLNSLKFVQSHRLTDVHLALGYGALALAATCFAWDYKLGFEETKYYSAAAVVVYVALSTALTLWQRYVEGAIVYEGTVPGSRGREKIVIRTTVEKCTPVYKLEATVQSASAKTPTVVSVARPFSEWFDSAGTFVAAPFQSMLASSIPVVGKADPKRVAAPSSTAEAAAVPTEYSAEMLEALAAATATATGSSTGGSHKSGGKRRKV